MSSSLPATPDGARRLLDSVDWRNPQPTGETVVRDSADSDRHFSCLTQYRKCHASLTWTIRDVSARDAHGERLRSSELSVGRGDDQTAWVLLCNFGTQNYEDYVSLHVKLVSKPSQDVCADVDIAIIAADGKRAHSESKVARRFSSTEDGSDGVDSTWGYFSFAKRADLRFNPDLIPNDTLTLVGKVSVYGSDLTTSSLDVPSASSRRGDHLERLSVELRRLFTDNQTLVSTGSEDGNEARREDDMVMVETETKKFLVHRSILSSRSSVFQRMLQPTSPPDNGVPAQDGATWAETGSGRVSVPDVDDDAMQSFLFYIYAADLPSDMDDQSVEDLMILGDRYDVEDLKLACEQMLGQTLSVTNVSRLLVLADRHRCASLKAAALRFLTHNPVQVMQTEDWHRIEEGHPSIVAEAFRAMALRE